MLNITDNQIRTIGLTLAKFEGYETEWESIYGNIIYSSDNSRTAIDTHYHKSWEWLMPIVELAFRVVEAKKIHPWRTSLAVALCTTDIKVVCKEVMDFVKYYNEEVDLEIYFQPKFEDKLPVDKDGRELFSFEVYKSKTECARDFPKHTIQTYIGEEIEGHSYIDSFGLEKENSVRFSSMDLDYEVNIPDLMSSLTKLVGIVDEDKGGIIAYAIGQEHADFIVETLEQTKEQFI